MPIDTRGIDHLVILTHNMDKAVDAYQKMGFTPMYRMLHPFGTANNLIMFESNFLEILGIVEPSKIIGIGSFIKQLLDKREGISHFALQSTDANADHQESVDKGFETIEVSGFEREVELPDGRKINAVVSVCGIQQPETPRVQIFFSQQHVAEAVWIPQWQQHANGALDVESVTILSEDAERDFGNLFRKLFGNKKIEVDDGNMVAKTPNGQIHVLTASSFQNKFTGTNIQTESVLPYVAAMTIKVRTVGVVEEILKTNKVSSWKTNSGSVLVGPEDGIGVVVEFIQ